MGEYKSDWFSFEIKSKRHVMDLAISPAFAKGIGFQVHEMKNNSYQLFWNFGMVGREIYSATVEYTRLNEIAPKTLTIKI